MVKPPVKSLVTAISNIDCFPMFALGLCSNPPFHSAASRVFHADHLRTIPVIAKEHLLCHSSSKVVEEGEGIFVVEIIFDDRKLGFGFDVLWHCF